MLSEVAAFVFLLVVIFTICSSMMKRTAKATDERAKKREEEKRRHDERGVNIRGFEVIEDTDEDDLTIAMEMALLSIQARDMATLEMSYDIMRPPYQPTPAYAFPTRKGMHFAFHGALKTTCEQCVNFVTTLTKQGTRPVYMCMLDNDIVKAGQICKDMMPRDEIKRELVTHDWKCRDCQEKIGTVDKVLGHKCSGEPTSNDECPDGYYRCWSCETPIKDELNTCHVCKKDQGRNRSEEYEDEEDEQDN